MLVMMPARAALWRLLLLDPDPGDPKWLLVTVSVPADVRPARLGADGSLADWPEITGWVAAQLGHGVQLAPVGGVRAWTIQPPA